MTKYYKTNHDGFVKDDKGLIHNHNKHELVSYREQIKRAKKLNDMEDKVADLSFKLDQVLKLINKEV